MVMVLAPSLRRRCWSAVAAAAAVLCLMHAETFDPIASLCSSGSPSGFMKTFKGFGYRRGCGAVDSDAPLRPHLKWAPEGCGAPSGSSRGGHWLSVSSPPLRIAVGSGKQCARASPKKTSLQGTDGGSFGRPDSRSAICQQDNNTATTHSLHRQTAAVRKRPAFSDPRHTIRVPTSEPSRRGVKTHHLRTSHVVDL